jgi:serine/threonine protein kinase
MERPVEVYEILGIKSSEEEPAVHDLPTDAGAQVEMSGRTLSRYKILRKVGSGGMGDVYLAHDGRLERSVALKILPPHVAADKERMRRFLLEARAACAVKHSGVAHIYEISEVKGVHFIAMEYVEGKTLKEVIGGQPTEVSQIFQIGAQLADALEEAHNQGVTHRDIKPANIMVTPRGQVKILDFGLAKISRGNGGQDSDSPLTQSGQIFGTVQYMSPEQAMGQRVDSRTDIFSLGVVLYEMAAGQRPFRANDDGSGEIMAEILVQILRSQPNSIPAIPKELEAIIFRCLEKDPELRYQTAGQLLYDLRNLSDTYRI